jgi:hypothetical protein
MAMGVIGLVRQRMRGNVSVRRSTESSLFVDEVNIDMYKIGHTWRRQKRTLWER